MTVHHSTPPPEQLPQAPDHYAGIAPELAHKIKVRIAQSALTIANATGSMVVAEAIGDLCDAIACREAERLRTECRQVWSEMNVRILDLEVRAGFKTDKAMDVLSGEQLAQRLRAQPDAREGV